MGDHVPHMHQMSVERDGQTVWVDGVRFALGKAIDTDNNCLIDTLRQKLNIVCSTDYVRQELQKLFARPGPSHVTAANFLDLQLHWADVIRLLGEAYGQRLRPESFRIVVVDVEYLGHGDVAGDGPTTFHIARENGNHFIPLIRQHGLA